MAINLYNNGIIEEFKPAGLTFTEEELIKSFSNYKTIRSKRLLDIPNTWCIWGESENPDPVEFNRICTDILEVYVFSHVTFVHDSELNPDWKMNDMIYKGYSDFSHELADFIDEMARKIVEETEEINKQQGVTDNMVLLNTTGQTADKKVVYTFNPEEQSEDFYKAGSFANFSDRIVEFWKNNKFQGDNKHLIIFEDKKIMITVLKENIDFLFSKLIKNFEVKEKYEVCSALTQLHQKIINKKKRGRPKKNQNEDIKKTGD